MRRDRPFAHTLKSRPYALTASRPYPHSLSRPLPSPSQPRVHSISPSRIASLSYSQIVSFSLTLCAAAPSRTRCTDARIPFPSFALRVAQVAGTAGEVEGSTLADGLEAKAAAEWGITEAIAPIAAELRNRDVVSYPQLTELLLAFAGPEGAATLVASAEATAEPAAE